ncbi:MAG: hypothetical protein ACHQRM_13700 [Bacteroidia bacterium]
MKKIAGLLMAASMIGMVACGTSEEDRKKTDAIESKKASHTADSLIEAMHDSDSKKDTAKKASAPVEAPKADGKDAPKK